MAEEELSEIEDIGAEDKEKLKELIEKHEIVSIDMKYSDLVGNWYHLTFPVSRLELIAQKGIPFDGSSIPGMRAVESGDMLLMPDFSTASRTVLPRGTDTLRINCSSAVA